MSAATLADLDRRQRAAVKRALATGKRGAAGTGKTVWDDARKFYQPRFPSGAQLGAVAADIKAAHGLPDWDGHEGPRARILVSAGTVAIGYKNLARRAKTDDRALIRHGHVVDELAAELLREEKFPAAPEPRSVIRKWSRKSRANMHAAFRQIDYQPFFARGEVPAMVTLTYPGDWLAVAPTGPTSKRHIALFRKRFERAWRIPLRAIWKLEFQERGAPHYHLMMTPPHGRAISGVYAGESFKPWLSETWAAVVKADEASGERKRHRHAGTRIDYADGLKATDPQRVATYFAKHGTFRAKEYQHNVPAEWTATTTGPDGKTIVLRGPGRFWGYWNMRRVVRGVEISHTAAAVAARTLRLWARANTGAHWDFRRKIWIPPSLMANLVPRYKAGRLTPTAPEVDGLAGAQEVEAQSPRRTRPVRRRIRRMRGRYGAGWVAANNGVRLAGEISRRLSLGADPCSRLIDRVINARAAPPPESTSDATCAECGEGLRRHRCWAWQASRAVRAEQKAAAGSFDCRWCHQRRPPNERHRCEAYQQHRREKAQAAASYKINGQFWRS